MSATRILITGGAGFVGSHVVAALLARGAAVTVLDNLSTGHRAAVLPDAELIVGDLGDADLLERVLAAQPWHAVFHFASLSLVGDSMRAPLHYLRHNIGNGLALIDACIRHQVPRFVLSSTAALFGQTTSDTTSDTIAEDAPIDPGSPYGESKAALERALLWADRLHGLRSAVLRYFNAAGADPAGRLGEDHRPESHLIPLIIDAALARRPSIALFGTDYPTPDGTCIRDYIHVTDLADAHLRALDRLDAGSVTYNLGTGHGNSVREVIDAVERVGGRKVPVDIAPRRPGDPARLVAAADRIRRDTGWQPRHSALDTIVAHAWAWRVAHPMGYAG